MGTKILVTGGAGYIGSHTCKRLAKAGYEPVTIDNLTTGHRWAAKWGPLIVGDVADRVVVESTIREHRIEGAIHFAAYAYVGESVQNPRKYFANNCSAMLNLLDTLVDTGVRDVIFSSSCATYGEPDRVPLDETHPQRPMSPYGDTKLFGERFLKWYSGAYGLRFAALRYFNASGADPDLETGEDHDPETHLIPNIMGAALGRRGPVEIFGTDYPTPDGTAIRDYVHVTDLADAHVRALEWLGANDENLHVNLGSGHGYSVREVVAMVETVGARPVPRIESPRREGDPPGLFANATKARTTLGWESSHSDLRTIVETAWAWENHRKIGQP